MTNRNSKLAAVITMSLMLAAVTVQASEAAWTSPGSVGIVEDGEVKRSLHIASLSSGMADGTTILRYNISATDALTADLRSGQSLELALQYRDGQSGRVRAFVKQSAMNATRTTILCSFDSEEAVESRGGAPFTFHHATAPALEAQAMEFDFQNNVYYLEVWLTKDGSGIGPAIAGASIKVSE